MRPSKQRSRSKANRPRTLGNVINRVFDSSGPDGKVRGTPQQIIDKYQVLARDAQLSNDRVAAENFLQHAEHYTRMLAEALRETQRDRDQNPNQNQNQQRDGNRDRGRDGASDEGERSEGRGDSGQDNRPDHDGGRNRDRQRDGARSVDVIDIDRSEAGLVDTPEARAKPDDQMPRPHGSGANGIAHSEGRRPATQPGEGAGDAAPATAERPARRPRQPRAADRRTVAEDVPTGAEPAPETGVETGAAAGDDATAAPRRRRAPRAAGAAEVRRPARRKTGTEDATPGQGGTGEG